MQLEGVYVPVVTPFAADESVDEGAFADVIEYVLDGGVAGVVVGGTTGEYYAMSAEERLAQIEFGAKVVAGRAQLIVGCNSGATRDVVGFARHARDHGYDAILLAAPPTSLPTQRELADHVVATADDAGLPVILYNYPARAGVEFGFDCLDMLADRPDIVAIKESSGDFSRFLALRQRYSGRIDVMCGSDDQAFDYLAWGTRSWLAGCANGLPRQHVEFTNAMLRGDIDRGRRCFAAILPWIAVLEAGRYVTKVKATMNHVGVAAGRVRRPLSPLSDAELGDLVAVLDEAMFAFDAADAG